jgi:hypothetical protein
LYYVVYIILNILNIFICYSNEFDDFIIGEKINMFFNERYYNYSFNSYGYYYKLNTNGTFISYYDALTLLEQKLYEYDNRGILIEFCILYNEIELFMLSLLVDLLNILDSCKGFVNLFVRKLLIFINIYKYLSYNFIYNLFI